MKKLLSLKEISSHGRRFPDGAGVNDLRHGEVIVTQIQEYDDGTEVILGEPPSGTKKPGKN